MEQRHRRRAIVFVVDGLGAGYLGPYGNTWLDTPIFNQLADAGMLLEQTLVDTVDLLALCESLWKGTHAGFPADSVRIPLAGEIGTDGTQLVTDSLQVANVPSASAFEHVDLVETASTRTLAETPDQTGLTRLVATALETWQDRAPRLLWVHARGMHAPWDAPWEFRGRYPDAEDPPPPDTPDPPEGRVPAGIDPDELQRWVWAYAGQVALLDFCFEPLWEQWQAAADPTLLIFVGARGFSLGEHGYWGESATQLHSERIHVPLLVAHNDRSLARIRSQTLIQPPHVHATLRDWFGVATPAESTGRSLLRLAEGDWSTEANSWANLAVCRSGSQWALRTPVWQACLSDVPEVSAADEATHEVRFPVELFLKPDDRWDVNDVADRCPEVVAGFRRLAAQAAALPPGSQPRDLLPLEPILLQPPE